MYLYFLTVKFQIHQHKKVQNLYIFNLKIQIYYLKRIQNIKNQNLLILQLIKMFIKNNYFVMFHQIWDNKLIQKINYNNNISRINLMHN